MLDNIHAHWKRRRVCKIKCKGVCTVDMDNVCEQLEVRCLAVSDSMLVKNLFNFSSRFCNYPKKIRGH